MLKGVIITHGDLGKELVLVAEKILEKESNIESISFDWKEDGSKIINKVNEFLKQNKSNDIIIFTDMFGGSPSNISLKFKRPNVEIITGINLPGLLKFLTYREQKKDLKEVARNIKKGAIDGISIISEYLGEDKR
jgi:PTS system mannose-specific IIA component